MRLIQPVVTDYQAVLEVLGTEPLSTREIAELVGRKMEATRTLLYAAEADGFVELLRHRNYEWRKRV